MGSAESWLGQVPSQVPLTVPSLARPSVDGNVWASTLAIPVYCAALSAGLHAFSTKRDSSAQRKPDDDSADSASSLATPRFQISYLRRRVSSAGGTVIALFRIIQSFSVLTLLTLSILPVVRIAPEIGRVSDAVLMLGISQCFLYGYIFLLNILSLLGSTQTNIRAFNHASTILAFAWGVYMYRDVWPLATIDLAPEDASEGTVMWIKIGLLSLSGVIIPLFSPKKYVPVDPKEPVEPPPEQTACILSGLFYAYLEPLIGLAWKLPRLTYDVLPPLADYDHLKNLVGRAFPYIDPLKTRSRRHLGLSFIRIFWVELCNLVAMSIAGVIGAFAAPISINNLLLYLESGKAETTIKPWFWIALFFFGRLFKGISDQWFGYYSTRLNVRFQAIITELVFEHALRIRLKADTDDSSSPAPSDAATAVGTPDDISQLTNGEDPEGGDANVDRSATASSSTTAAPPAKSIKGKAKSISEDQPQSAEPDKPAKKETGRHLVGRINNLVTSDLNNIDGFGVYLVFIGIEAPFEMILSMIFLYQVLEWSALVGLVAMLITLPLPGWITRHIQYAQREKMKRTDSRVQTVTEILGVIRMIKLFGWEPRIAEQLDKKREEELKALRKSKLISMSIGLCNSLIPIMIMLSTFFTYTVIMKRQLTASRVFSSMAVFDMLRNDMYAVFSMVPSLVDAKVSLERIADFLWNTELIDSFESRPEPGEEEICANAVPDDHKDVIGIRHASFAWSKDSVPSVEPGRPQKRTFILSVDDELTFQRGKLNLVIGPTGAGKTSLLMALLGEMHYIPSGPDSYMNLPRDGGVAYAAQESWVQNDTIRNNILFGAPYDDVRYNRVLHQCALKRDLSLFEAGDQTEVGEKGITLSGGQKARVTLARTVYSDADILLLDDVTKKTAALDVHTSKWIVDKCLKGDLLQGRTVILVTHNVAMVSPIADFVVSMGSDGRILSQGSLLSALERDSKLMQEMKEEQEEIRKAEGEIDAEDEDKFEDEATKQVAGKLVVAEEMEDGHVGWSAMKLFLGNMSKRPFIFWAIYVGSNAFRQCINNFRTYYLGYWASQYETHPAEEVSVSRYMTVYALLVLLFVGTTVFTVSFYVYGSMRAARIVHKQLVVSILGTTLRWLDKTPTARVIARCTQDIDTLDNRIARNTSLLVEITLFMLVRVLAIILFSPVFIFPAIFVTSMSALCGHAFMKAQLSVKRELSNSKAPVLAHFGATISGITSVRAYGAQEAFKREAYRRIDRLTRVTMTYSNLNRWIGSRIDLLACLFATSLALYLVYFSDMSAANTGFSLTIATAFSAAIDQAIRVFNDFEISGNSLERIQQYLQIEQEPKPTPDGVPPAYWPASGQLAVDKLSARYSPDGPKVLHEISFEVAAGERVGIVGRTGSGKSSLTLALLRCILTEGNVRYDGLPTDKVNLDALRSNITIIPQVPELLSGTIRQNLDPFSEHDDAILNDALRSAGLFNLQAEDHQSRITLEAEIAGGGANLSVGQRQILALARAIVRRSKLLILDEGRLYTPSPHYETDTIIQTSLRTELGKDVTLLTVAHRLQTIMDSDKIMVLDAGHIVEYGKPSELLQKENGVLRALVEESGDKEKLYRMAKGAPSS
ncbi:P-loop containing nucleoside triphosphate hydrolase protein [Cubamyces sp. BRFM 1775]|nr:P-loop containing nucleoside triphosphate hydrolase protein [Cubamyces sp. BRFM 1775]